MERMGKMRGGGGEGRGEHIAVAGGAVKICLMYSNNKVVGVKMKQ